LEPVPGQQAPQHPSACKGKFRVQLVDPMHQMSVSVRDRAGLTMTLP
jgi:hypothetical protein